MGSWLTPLVSVLLMVLLGGGAAIASICESLCMGDVSAVSSQASDLAGHHHGRSDAPPAATAEQHSEHADASVIPEGSTHAFAQGGRSMSCASDCCELLGRPRTSLAADRGDSRLIPPLAITSSAAALAEPGPQRWRDGLGSPPGQRSAPALLVLRI